MKNLISICALQFIMICALQSQPVSDYLYKLDNGITVKTEHTWSQVWVQQSYAPLAATDKIPLGVTIRTLGDLISSSSYQLESKGKEVPMKSAAPGTYNLKMSFKLSGEPGTLSFNISNILIKEKTKTNVTVTLYDYQIMVDESATASSNLSSFETAVKRCKVTPVQADLFSIPAFYTKENHSKSITPDESTAKTKGKIKPGTYDMLLTIPISGQNHRIWLENFQMKPGKSYMLTANLNAGGIVYAGSRRDVKAMHLYPAGTAAKQTGAAAPVKNLQIISYNNVMNLNCCTPGVFDVLLQAGDKYEWRKNVAVTTGSKTEVR